MLKLRGFLPLVIVSALLPLYAQENRGTILGRVTDPSGAVVASAHITIERVETGEKTSTLTNEQGNYLSPYLPPGTYRVTVAAPGFQGEENPDVVLKIQQVARVDFKLQLGNVTEKLAVTASAPLLVTDDATIGQVTDTKTIVELPVAGRNLSSLTLLGTGMATTANGIANTVAPLFTGGVTMTANGVRTSANQYSVDGANINVGFYNFPGFVPPLDTVDEFKVRTGNYSAEYGGFGGAHVDYSLRSGTNQFHGTLWEYFSNDKLNARNVFALSTPYLRQNQFGALASGPIIRNKTFFMASYEGFRKENQTIAQTTVPTAAMRSGDLSHTITGAVQPPIPDPLNGSVFAGNQIPASRISAVTQRLLAFYPLPNLPGAVNYQAQVPIPQNRNTVLGKIDQIISLNNRFSARYVFQQTEQPSAIPIIADFGTRIPIRAQNATISDTHVFSPSTLLDVHLSWNRTLLRELSPRAGSDYDVQKELGINVPSTARPGSIENEIPSVGISGFAGLGDSNVAPTVQPDENYQLVGTFSSLKGKHALKAGAEILKARSARFQGRFTNGSISFQPGNAGGSGNAFADFLLGLPQSSSITTIPAVVDMRQVSISPFIADTWTIAPRLTLNLGLRYEYDGPPSETHGRIPVFSFTPPGGFTTLRPGQHLFTEDYNNFAPRIGFAYRPIGKTVIRAAYGVFYSEPKLLGMNVKGINPPFIVSESFFSSAANPLQIADPFPLGLAAAGGVPAPNSYQVNRRTPYIQEWSFNVQRQIARDWMIDVGYVGNLALKMGRQVMLNIPLTPGPGAIQARRPLPDFGPATHFQYDANSNYHSFQARVEKQFSAGFSLMAAYTFGRNIDISGDEQSGVTVDPRNLDLDRGLSESQVKNRLTVSYIWELPFGPGKPFLNHGKVLGGFVGGWQLSGVTLFQSGNALTVTATGDSANVGLGTRPVRVCDGALDDSSIREWFNTACFVAPAPFTYGNSGRGVIIGPGKQTWDVGVAKRFRVTERHFVQFRAEYFNTFNHPNLGTPGLTLGTPAFGTITSADQARTAQLALKYGF